jgi:hypothetical protein
VTLSSAAKFLEEGGSGLVSGPRACALEAERGHGTAREHGESGAEEAGARKKKEKRKWGRRQVRPSSQRKREGEPGCCWAECREGKELGLREKERGMGRGEGSRPVGEERDGPG